MSWIEMVPAGQGATSIDRYRHPRFQAASTSVGVGGHRRTSPDKLLLSAGEGAGSVGKGGWRQKNRDFSRFFKVVPAEGLEPPHPSGQQILSLSRLPFRHAGTVVRLSERTYRWRPGLGN